MSVARSPKSQLLPGRVSKMQSSPGFSGTAGLCVTSRRPTAVPRFGRRVVDVARLKSERLCPPSTKPPDSPLDVDYEVFREMMEALMSLAEAGPRNQYE